MKKSAIKTLADRYAKIVEWSAGDACYIGRVPALGYGGVHGKDRAKVFEEICLVAEEIVAIHIADGRGLPAAEPKKYSGKFLLRIPAGLHEALAIEAEKNGVGLNAVATEALRAGLQHA